MFSWENEIENLGDLKRLKLVLEHMPDESLMLKLEKARGRGRDAYPIRAMWNAVIAMVVLGHARYADLIRELRRNVQLRHMCGFQFLESVPGADNMSRFVKKLKAHESDVLLVFVELSEMLYEILPDFGEHLAIDSKWVYSSANKRSKRENSDARSETEAEWGVKEYRSVDEDGVLWNSKKKCFGFKIHLLVDAKYELPIAFINSSASGSDVTWGKMLLNEIEKSRPHVLQRCQYFMADRGYDDTNLILWLKEHEIKAVIDKRNLWKSEKEKQLPGHENIFYDEKGAAFCYEKESGQRHMLRTGGYDSERDALRKECPVSSVGASCDGALTCSYCKNIRIPLKTDPRIFTQVDRQSYKWERLYAMRTAVERVNSRLDVSFGFEARRVRGMKKMNLLCALALAVMDALAVAAIKTGRAERMRSLTRAA
jgi:hypothetical protein